MKVEKNVPAKKAPIKVEKKEEKPQFVQIEKPMVEKQKSVESKSEDIKKQEKKEGLKDINDFMAKKNEIKK